MMGTLQRVLKADVGVDFAELLAILDFIQSRRAMESQPDWLARLDVSTCQAFKTLIRDSMAELGMWH